MGDAAGSEITAVMDVKKVPNGRAAINAAYGIPGDDESVWYQHNIITLRLPFQLWYERDDGSLQPISTVKFHRLAAPNLYAALLAVWLHARLEVKKEHGYDLSTEQYDLLTNAWLKERHLSNYNGTYNYRKTRGSSTAYSAHAYGIAIDLDASQNPLGSTKTTFPDWFIKCFKDQGFFWGGDYKSRPDPMHFLLAKGI